MVSKKSSVIRISTDDLEGTIEAFISEEGYRLDMIKPADHPIKAVLSKHDSELHISERRLPRSTKKGVIHSVAPTIEPDEWHVGRAGMEYRDLIPDRLGGKVIASHIRLTTGGEVPDYVHYHKVDFQMIYCVKGRIKVVYEDQGAPFWLETGDCVLQPPEIRHRVLECTAGAEVIEVSMPAEHETWVEHDITLPTSTLNPMREFSGQRFVRHIAAENIDQNGRDLGISAATGGRCNALVQKITAEEDLPANDRESGLFFRLNDSEILAVKLSM